MRFVHGVAPSPVSRTPGLERNLAVRRTLEFARRDGPGPERNSADAPGAADLSAACGRRASISRTRVRNATRLSIRPSSADSASGAAPGYTRSPSNPAPLQLNTRSTNATSCASTARNSAPANRDAHGYGVVVGPTRKARRCTDSAAAERAE